MTLDSYQTAVETLDSPSVVFTIEGAWGSEKIKKKPKRVQFGLKRNGNEMSIDSVSRVRFSPNISPIIHFSWNTHVKGLPPWNEVKTLKLKENRSRFIFRNIKKSEKQETGNLKTVSLIAEECEEL